MNTTNVTYLKIEMQNRKAKTARQHFYFDHQYTTGSYIYICNMYNVCPAFNGVNRKECKCLFNAWKIKTKRKSKIERKKEWKKN